MPLFRPPSPGGGFFLSPLPLCRHHGRFVVRFVTNSVAGLVGRITVRFTVRFVVRTTSKPRRDVRQVPGRAAFEILLS